jgi:hypothetical protein
LEWVKSSDRSTNILWCFTLKVFRSDGSSLLTYTNICCNSPFFQS